MPEEAVQKPETPAPQRFEIPSFADLQVIPEPAEVVAPDGQNTGEQATPPVSDGEKPKEEASKEEVTPEQAAKRDGRRFERKLDKAYRQRAEAQARADVLAKEIETLKAQSAPKPAVEGEPKLEQFDYDPEKYAAAKSEFAKKQAEKEFQTKQQTEAQKQYRDKLIAGWDEKVDKVEDKYDDWQEKVGTIQPNSPFTAAIFDADNGPDIAYYLGSHPKEAMRIAQLSPLSQVREIGKLEAKLAAEPAKPKAPSKAPAPITPLTGAAPAITEGPSDNDDTATWIRKRNKQVHGRR